MEKAQQIPLSINLVEAAKKQLVFLAVVDLNPGLYNGPLLDRAIERYKNCWLPLLAKQMESVVDLGGVKEGPLVVPLDCEWIWHCHRLNPVQYARDCKELFGRILDNGNVLSTLQGPSTKHSETIWNQMYPTEPYHLDLTRIDTTEINAITFGAQRSTEYDLKAAVERQSTFFSRITNSMAYNQRFLEEAVARYRAFLHIVKLNKEKNMPYFCVPTSDIDLIWHTHQLYPVAYCRDTIGLLGKLLDHNDNIRDWEKSELDLQFSGTAKMWEENFGVKYEKEEAFSRHGATHEDPKHQSTCLCGLRCVVGEPSEDPKHQSSSLCGLRCVAGDPSEKQSVMAV